MKFPFTKQLDVMDCGPACLNMIAKYYGKNIPINELREMCYITKSGVNMLGISEAANHLGLNSKGLKMGVNQLIHNYSSPCILHWNQKHFVVLYNIKNKFYSFKNVKRNSYTFYIADPAYGLLSFSQEDFIKNWICSQNQENGILMNINPTDDFYKLEEKSKTLSYKYLLKYLISYKTLLCYVFIGLLIGSVLQLIAPFLTQAIVDKGIVYKNINLVEIILIAQIGLVLSRTILDYIRRWILLKIGANLNLSLITDFIIKLIKLPMRFYDTKLTGDLIRRVDDHKRLELFLTNSLLNITFSFITVLILSIVLALYSLEIFFIFLFGSILYVVWIKLFLKKRADLDRKNFSLSSKYQSFLIELIQSMPEIKLTGCEKNKISRWNSLQNSIFDVSFKSLSLEQWQQTGGVFINEIKNISITIIAATSVISGEITLGMMISIQFIIGQMQWPIDQIVSFVKIAQDANISLKRLNEVHERTDEEIVSNSSFVNIPNDGDIIIKNMKFSYGSPSVKMLIDDISLHIPYGKVTAIVGMSGSGKTTLLKLLLRYYQLYSGNIIVGDVPLENISFKEWRKNCGVVLQDGYIFSDSIAFNIATGDDNIDIKRIKYAAEIANINEFIEKLPLQYNTLIGNSGMGLSQGQKQRLLIARVVYKNPKYVFFDEATNALDSTNEKSIMKNLALFLKGKTVVVVAHRLSTIKKSDQIVVLDNGKITEVGTHYELIRSGNDYFNLIKDQLEITTLNL